ncbi:MAG: rod shape-determining protein RodA [Synergistales bacterium]|nr:rod shape-determining protein RodA [Synergistales bacterium]
MEHNRETTFLERLLAMDFWMLLIAGSLFMIGVVSVYSAAYGTGQSYALRQGVWGVLSLIALLVTLRVGHREALRIAYQLYWLLLLVMVWVLVVGISSHGAKSWVAIGPFTLQPSEFGKVVLALVLGKHLSRHPPTSGANFLLVLAVAGLGGVLVLAQPDLGSAGVYAVMTLVAVFLAGSPMLYLGGLMGGVLLLLPVGWQLLREYQRLRLLVFINPHIDPLGAGYNVIQSRIAVGSGGLLGKGFLEGTQSKLRFLPEPHTDFIFSVFAEENGFIGTTTVLILFGLLLWRIMRAGIKTRDLRSKVMTGCIAAWIWFQLMECVAMSMGLAPITGLPLPFLSYGGSALLALGIALGLVQSVYVEVQRQYE